MFKKLLFALHLRNTKPTRVYYTNRDYVPGTIIRTDGESHDVRPDTYVVDSRGDEYSQNVELKDDGQIAPRPFKTRADWLEGDKRGR